jgi:hypothetical protein
MYLTEEEAKTKWCPEVRWPDEQGTWNRMESMIKRWFGWSGKYPYPDEACNCIASECMMWRQEHVRYELSKKFSEMSDEELVEGATKPSKMEFGNRGYCGLGGKP